ncbi:patatin-like phospholipase family protein [Pyxidicoccus xibeiensis]|uniref:patatin-like phospholipase family protein n=1 Tax=Pyxidicoccus xibeiensis TaxID=2906759 RepID=UPI0020A7386C|nr:patatin-like phospholipase family protein [Pyxidicoccus xibeiensis]MCP3142384.1 patatin-like phospholipase family protein [Pyxidicoccus xibeiensis]
MTERPATLVLSGGGAKGAFQVGAERVLREVHGFRWERIFGVSVGALNAALLAQHAFKELNDVWLNIRETDVYRKFPWPVIALRLGLLRKLGLYDGTPLRDFIYRNAAGRPFVVPAHVGRVSLVSGNYELVPSEAKDFLDAVWQSATMPVIWEPIGPTAIVDGGLRNVTPLGDALQFGPTEIVVIACSSPKLESAKAPANILDVAKRSLVDITINEILLNDVDTFVRINDIVRQAYEEGYTLRRPDGVPYRYCRITVIEPAKPLGDTLDFSPEMIRMRMRHGEEMARSALKPTGVGPGERMPPQVGPDYHEPTLRPV